MVDEDLEYFEKLLIRILFSKVELRDKVMPYLSIDLFSDESNQGLVKEIISFNTKYNAFPKATDLLLNIEREDVKKALKEIAKIDPSKYHEENMMARIEDFFKKKMLWNEFANNVDLLKEGKIEEIDPQKIIEAKAFTFDTSIGLEVFEDDGEQFYNDLHDEDQFIPTGLKQFDFMMDGGFRRKALSLLIGGTNKGKTLWKCSLAKQCLLQGYNVLFIPLEGTQKNIRDRIMYNMMDYSQAELKGLDKREFKDLFAKIKTAVNKRLVVKEYSEHTLNANKLRLLLKELKEKKNFIPDIVFIDYMGLVIPNVISKEGNPAFMLKRASEEFHAVAKEYNLAMVSSMQFNRKGYASSDPDMDDISESFGTLFTADEVILIIQTDDMLKEMRYIYKKVKARTPNKGFVGNICVDYNKMKLYESEDKSSPEQKKKMNELVEKESSEVQEILEKASEAQVRKILDVEFT